MKNYRRKPDNIAFLQADYEMGLKSKQKIAIEYQISTVTLWRYAKNGEWIYRKNMTKVMDEVSKASVKRLMEMRSDILEEHALTLSLLREEIMVTEDMKELKRLSSRLDAVLECIKAERLCFGLPSEIQQQVNHQK